jgi:electron transfer flavoprotein beta subunit
MKIMVCIKQVGFLDDEVELVDGGDGIDPECLEYATNEWDLCAVEAALALRDVHGGEVTAVSVTDADGEVALRQALAMGVDRAVRIEAPTVLPFDPLGTARAIDGAIAEEQPDLVLCGAQSSDGGQGGTPAALAALLDSPCIAVACALTWDDTAGQLLATRELEGGILADVAVTPPCVVSVQTGINRPRYTTFRQIKQANARELEVRLVNDVEPGFQLRGLSLPEVSDRAQMIDGEINDVAGRLATLIRDRLS